MAKYISRVYATACEKQGKNFNTVPKELQTEVRKIIKKDGYVINDDGTVTQGEEG